MSIQDDYYDVLSKLEGTEEQKSFEKIWSAFCEYESEVEGCTGDPTTAFNAAIDFALDEADGDGITFLSMWREGDWNGIAREFPEFDLQTTGQVKC